MALFLLHAEGMKFEITPLGVLALRVWQEINDMRPLIRPLKVATGSWRLYCSACGMVGWYLTRQEAQAGAVRHESDKHAEELTP